ncbi:MAG: cell division protein ZipA C-terminal FtsZ-binding domain-containing protein [Gammaproteobacteria bacterium]|uniref:Cell division protein ZipA n=1 Tax=Candidatus Thiopontia autotrophica TaxID=2841688 RepID=A0A8J6P8Z9_9GAMM|nr:cell division protein ZipA C-terminal FtsZ-binding domain-containing protein [Candidatus Thiopontia autotrophica]
MGLLTKIKTILEKGDTRRQSGQNHDEPIDLGEWSFDDEHDLELDDIDLEDGVGDGVARSVDDSDPDNSSDAVGLAVTLTVMAREGDHFEGGDLLREFTATGLEMGKDGFYHVYSADSQRGRSQGQQEPPLFTVSNVLAPGVFDQQQIMNLRTTGIALFFRLPSKYSGKQAFEKMAETSHKIAVGLGGQVCDSERKALTPHSLQNLRDQVYEFEYNQELESRRAAIEQPK